MTGTLVTVTATRTAADGAPDTGTISLAPIVPAPNTDPKRTVTQAPVSADLDEQGAWTVAVTASDDPDWATDGPVPYTVTERLGGLRRQWTAYIDGPGPVDLDDLQPLVEVDPPAAAADWLTPAEGDARYLVRETGGIVRGPIVLWREGGVLAAGQIAVVPDPGTPGGDALELKSDDGILIRGPYLVLDTTNLVIVQPGGEVGSPLVVAGFDALGGALMGWGAPVVPAYQVVDSTEAPVTIKAAGAAVPSPWVPLGLEVVCAETIAAGTGTLAFSMVLLNPTGRSGSVEYGLQINGSAPFAREVRQDVPANFNATVALSIINARDITAGDTLTLVARCVEQSHAQFAVSMEASAAEPARLRVSRA